jgi:uncharacterized protein DUF6796
MERRLRNRRLCGIAGLLGALLFFGGDMLFYGHAVPGATFHEGMQQVVREASLARLFTGGLLGPVAACFCIIGFWHVGQNITPRSPLLGQLTFYSLAAMMVAGSAVHALWVPRGLAFKYEAALSRCVPDLFTALCRYWEVAYNLAAVPAYFGAVLLLVVVVFRWSIYPRWTALANFGLLSLLAPAAARMPGPFGAILVGGFTNLSIAFFFLVSVLTTWNATEV